MHRGSVKQLVFEQFALVGHAVSSAHRLELLDVLAQGERSVENLSRACCMPIGSTSQHLQQLRRAGLVTGRKLGKHVIYSLADPEVIHLVHALTRVAERNLAEIQRLVLRYYSARDSLEPVGRDELQARLRKRSVVVVDVRPVEEYTAGHLPGAVSVPLSELTQRLKELPKTREIVACCRGPYCVYSYDAIEILRPKGFHVRRLKGGFFEWLAAGLPVERGSMSVPTRRRAIPLPRPN